MRAPVLLLSLILAAFALAGCGKKGALYLPDRTTPPASTQQSGQ